ncbi:helix-turn-helix domain-containing protein [Pareuzebyella sediminis]|uniref:helix-turn-helix domain-containing protein n=1 Tax=Pareuzebyella sediminis TaxID=2607998 RepID=UPI0011EE38EF|nr:helix-turn-helix domain-containing protein [Pareuzebyella sediminis]
MGSPINLIALLFFYTLSISAIHIPIDPEGHEVWLDSQEYRNLLKKADSFYLEHKYADAIKAYDLVLKTHTEIKAPVLKKIALSHAALDHIDACVDYIERSLHFEFDPVILQDERFDSVRETKAFNTLYKKYDPSFDVWSLIYFYVSLIGFYIAIVINFNKKIDRIARTLISLFIFIHSFFILHICVSITNYEYVFPHSYMMSTIFSLLYGPLLYFYFKRTTQEYFFKRIDLLHLVPTILLSVYLIPIYLLDAEEKLALLFRDVEEGFSMANFAVTALKLTSLIGYGYFIRRLYVKSKKSGELSKQTALWQRNLYYIHFMYIASYLLYCIFISNGLALFHSQVICMALMVLYIGYFASVQPDVFSGVFSLNNQVLFKYEKSGLTESLSKELMENLRKLFDIDKIYKENDICLEMIAERLNTTRHNASQVINEHFDMNFHELVNKYRIEEAKSMLCKDRKNNLNIIDIAYEVGYNNKVTFNKAFKKDTKLTPSQYQKKVVSS